MRAPRYPAALTLLLVSFSAYAADSAVDVLSLQQQRDQQQLELRLRMQQQQERALRPSPNAFTELQRGRLERDQQQRQREIHDSESRTANVPSVFSDERSDRTRRELQSERAAQSGAEQLQRFEYERRIESERPEPPSVH